MNTSHPYDLVIGLDRSDQKADLCFIDTHTAVRALVFKWQRIIWHLIKYRLPYDPSVWKPAEAKLKQKKIKRLQQNAAALGFQLLCTS